ncbi:MAG: bacillithiol system redox-active protein YtxJ [bacterium]|nr:bacillithiol system redox-active protein YtxJ [bacterium]
MSDYFRLQSISEIDELIEKSGETPVLFFKHSLTCPISRAALRQYESFLADRPEGDLTTYTLIEIQNARELSSDLAERTGVRHESPQALFVRGGEVAWHASHWSIQSEALAEAVGD